MEEVEDGSWKMEVTVCSEKADQIKNQFITRPFLFLII
jgi:hypothetical protein